MNYSVLLFGADLRPYAIIMDLLVSLYIAGYIFTLFIKNKMPNWAEKPTVWIAWWALANAIALMVDVIVDGFNHVSYGNIGIITEACINFGLIIFMYRLWGNVVNNETE